MAVAGQPAVQGLAPLWSRPHRLPLAGFSCPLLSQVSPSPGSSAEGLAGEGDARGSGDKGVKGSHVFLLWALVWVICCHTVDAGPAFDLGSPSPGLSSPLATQPSLHLPGSSSPFILSSSREPPPPPSRVSVPPAQTCLRALAVSVLARASPHCPPHSCESDSGRDMGLCTYDQQPG